MKLQSSEHVIYLYILQYEALKKHIKEITVYNRMLRHGWSLIKVINLHVKRFAESYVWCLQSSQQVCRTIPVGENIAVFLD